MTPVNTIAGLVIERVRECERRIEIGDIDPVADIVDAGGGFGGKRGEQFRLGPRYEQDRVGACRGPPFKRQQRAALAPVDHARRPAAGLGILPPFLGIDIDHVEHDPCAREVGNVRSHRRAIDIDEVGPVGGGQPVDGGTQPPVAEIELRQRGAGQQAGKAAQLGAPRR